MIRTVLAGAIFLAAMGFAAPSVQAGDVSASGSTIQLTDAHIAQAKAALRLTEAQQRHWPRVAAALRSFSRQGNGMASQISNARRVIAAARPLFRSLDAEQKQTALMMVRSLGFGYLAAAL